MPKVKIVSGVFGWKTDKGNELVRAGDPPINVDAAQAERLVERLRVAEYVKTEETPGDILSALNAQELRAAGKEYGLTFPVGTTKAEMKQAIYDAMNHSADEDFEDDSAEEFVDGDADEIPSFNAAEAVQ